MELNDKIKSYLRSKYNRQRKIPDIVKMYSADPNKGWLIVVLNWKREMLTRFSNNPDSLSSEQQLSIIETAIKKGL